jgi:hypothetical protein
MKFYINEIKNQIFKLQKTLGVSEVVSEELLSKIFKAAMQVRNNRNNPELIKSIPILYIHIVYGIPQNYLIDLFDKEISSSFYYGFSKSILKKLNVPIQERNKKLIDFLAKDDEKLKDTLKAYDDFRDIIVMYNIYMKQKLRGFIIKQNLYGVSEPTFRLHKKQFSEFDGRAKVM